MKGILDGALDGCPRAGAVNGPDPTAPDVEGARGRYPDWTFWRDGRDWLARRADGSAQLSGQSLESVEGKVGRAERARARARSGFPPGEPGARSSGPPGGRPPETSGKPGT
ncbi:MAG TPA: hypothetical protein VGG75_27200 [Trebonia sp.]